MQAYEELLYAVRNGVATITINRPERLNAWTPTLERELRQAMDGAKQDEAVRCVLLTGAGRAFCAGMDMAVLQSSGAATAPARPPMPASEEDSQQRYGYLWETGKPMIAAINGPASGVGLCLALYCDLRYVAAGAKLSFPYARRGLVAEHGTAWLLPRLIGPLAASELLLTGRTFSAEDADRMGLARVLPADGFLDAARAVATEIAALSSPRSVRIMKRQLQDARYQTLGQATRMADAEVAQCRGTEDFKEGVAHFIEKRAPRFTGR